MANGHGGKRAGSGRKPGSRNEELERVLAKAISFEDRVDAMRILAAVARSGSVPALTLLLGYLYGKPTPILDIAEDEADVEQARDLSLLTPQELETLDALLRKCTLDTGGDGGEGQA